MFDYTFSNHSIIVLYIGVNQIYVGMEGRNVTAVYMRSNPSRKNAADQLVVFLCAGQHLKSRTIHMVPIRDLNFSHYNILNWYKVNINLILLVKR